MKKVKTKKYNSPVKIGVSPVFLREKILLVEKEKQMKDFLNIGSSPYAENCVQLGSPDYQEKAIKECSIFAKQLLRQFPNIPVGCKVGIKSFQHDFGTYFETVIYFDNENEEQCNYAYQVEAGFPEFWDEQSKTELNK